MTDTERSALRELVAKWRKNALPHLDRWQCANELEAFIEREAAASLSPRPTMWCETCRDLHGPSGPHVGEIIPPEKAELLREIDRQHAIELDASLSPRQPSAEDGLFLDPATRELRQRDGETIRTMARATCADGYVELTRLLLTAALHASQKGEGIND
jgi:hypothetical protein